MRRRRCLYLVESQLLFAIGSFSFSFYSSMNHRSFRSFQLNTHFSCANKMRIIDWLSNAKWRKLTYWLFPPFFYMANERETRRLLLFMIKMLFELEIFAYFRFCVFWTFNQSQWHRNGYTWSDPRVQIFVHCSFAVQHNWFLLYQSHLDLFFSDSKNPPNHWAINIVQKQLKCSLCYQRPSIETNNRWMNGRNYAIHTDNIYGTTLSLLIRDPLYHIIFIFTL